MIHISQMPADVYQAIKKLFPETSLIIQLLDERTVHLDIERCQIEIKLSQLQELASLLGADDIAVEIVGYAEHVTAILECEITCTGVDVLGLGRGDDGK